jgi:hypothetical protein
LIAVIQGRTLANFSAFVMQKYYAFIACLRKCLIIKEAEGVRFELTRPFGLPVFKTGAINRSATPPDRRAFAIANSLLHYSATPSEITQPFTTGVSE